MIRVLIADDHRLVRDGIGRILDDSEDIEVVGLAGSGEEALRLAEHHNPDVVLMDMYMPGIGGVEAARRLLARGIARVICVTTHATGPFPRQLLESGLLGYITKGCDAGEAILAIRRVSDGKRYLSAEIARELAHGSISGVDRSPLETLSDRELQVFSMITNGLAPRDISERLSISPKTVSTYRSRIFGKLGIKSDVELMRIAIDFGLLASEAIAAEETG